MRKAASAWGEVDTSTIRNCWRKSGILPDAVLAPPATVPTLDPIHLVEQDLERRLDDLQERGVLQAANHMSIESLLNPAEEKELIDEATTVEDIFMAVMASRDAQEMGEINGGDDDVDDDADFEPRPTCREALGAVSTLLKYTASMDDNFARKMEQLLSSFGRQTQLEETNALVTVPITQFFDKVA
jgi:hypothetical protein